MQYAFYSLAFANAAVAQVYGTLAPAPIASSAPVYVPSVVPLPISPLPSSNVSFTVLPIPISSGLPPVYGSAVVPGPVPPVYGTSGIPAPRPPYTIVPAPGPHPPVYGTPVPLPIPTEDITTYTTVCPTTAVITSEGSRIIITSTITSTITTCIKCSGSAYSTLPVETPAHPPVGSASVPAGETPVPPPAKTPNPPAVPPQKSVPVGSEVPVPPPKITATKPPTLYTGAAVAVKPAGALVAGAAAAAFFL